MAKYEVTLTTPIRTKDVRIESGEVIEVDDVLLEELEKHNAVTNVKEKKAAAKKTPAKKDEPTDESGE